MNSSMLPRLIGLIPAFLLAGATARAADVPDFTLHEWGTFTFVSGSDGVLLPGLEREESLPPFVRQIDGEAGRYKGYFRPVHNVTIKMETPVIYFCRRTP